VERRAVGTMTGYDGDMASSTAVDTARHAPPRLAPPPLHGAARREDQCRYCGRQVAHGALCDGLTCMTRDRAARAEQARRHAQAQDEARAARITARLSPLIAALQAEGLTPHLVPHTSARVVPVPVHLRDAYLLRLDTLLAEVFGPEGEAHLAAAREDLAKRQAAVEGAGQEVGVLACVACRGMCCATGHDELAFTDVPTLAQQRLRDPELTAEALRERYVARLPERHLQRGCVFQAETGCTLDRNARAAICNEFSCSLRERMMAGGASASRAVAVGASFSNDNDIAHAPGRMCRARYDDEAIAVTEGPVPDPAP